MDTATRKPGRGGSGLKDQPLFLFHPSFAEPDAEKAYGGEPASAGPGASFMPEDVTRDWAKRMHYAAWRASTAPSERKATRWRQCYYDCRDRIVLGNRKLAFRAVQKWSPGARFADDMAAECQVVLIKAVAAFNPWLGIRFSTYAFTCLMRALSRLSQRQAADRLSRSIPLASLPGGEPTWTMPDDQAGSGLGRLGEYLREGHTLLTPREKTVLIRRYHLDEDVAERETLEEVGRDLGLSKERVRQVQSAALKKLRVALLAETSRS